MTQHRYPESQALETGKRGNYIYAIVRQPLGHHCGYVRFPRRFLLEGGSKGILTYAPVHGGITYAEQGKDGSMVYGFDCNHAGDEGDPMFSDMEWLRHECRVMAAAIYLARRFEERYLRSSDEARAKVVDEYHEAVESVTGRDFVLTDNFGAMLNVIFGGI